jgi:hypothetical protein
MALAIGIGLMLSGMLPEAASVIETPTPVPSISLVPSPSGEASPSEKPTPKPTPEVIGTVTFGLGLNQSTEEVLDETDTFTPSDQFCHSIALPERFGVQNVQEEVLKVDGDTLTVVQPRQEGFNPIGKNARVVGFCVSGQVVVDAWGTGDFIMRDYRRKNGLELLAEGRFTLNP